MARFSDSPVVEVQADIAAPPATVWQLVTDLDLPARFQDEFRGAHWLDDGPALEARFLGRNERKGRTWETTSWVVAYEPERVFGWAVSDRDNPGATWTFTLEPLDGHTRLRYHRRLGPGPSGITHIIEKHPDSEEEIIAARDAMHRENMQAVVDGVKALAEGGEL